MDTKISTWGNSKAIRIPAYIVNQLNLKNNQPLDIEVKDTSLVITPKVKEAETVEELFSDYNISFHYSEEELDWGKAEGEELEW